MNLHTYQSVASGTPTDTSTSVSDSNNAGTWTWSSTDSIIWNWNEGLSQGVNFPGYSTATISPATISPSASVTFGTNYVFLPTGDSVNSGPVAGLAMGFSIA